MRIFSTAFVIWVSTTSLVLANDIVISGGRVIDPESGLDAIRNVAIDDGKIVLVNVGSHDEVY